MAQWQVRIIVNEGDKFWLDWCDCTAEEAAKFLSEGDKVRLVGGE